MLIYRRTSLFESTAQTLVNTVNCVGVMGKGIAREFKDREPDMFAAYKRICDQGKLTPGKLWLWKGADQWVLNFPTKVHWRHPSKIEWVESGLQKFADNWEKLGVRQISFPRLGCGNGGLDWDEVKPLMERYLAPLDRVQVYIHDYTVDVGLPEHMEPIAQSLRGSRPTELSFKRFLEDLNRATRLSLDALADLQTCEPISADMSADDELTLRTHEGTWTFDTDDLWGIWIALQKGVLTQEKTGWAVAEAGRPLLSVLSLLPDVRPIEIQRFDKADPELALEMLPGSTGAQMVPASNDQTSSWH